MRIAINGMGRIGRLLFRRLIQDRQFTIIAVNDIMEAGNLAYLLKYDSLYGPFRGSISSTNKQLEVNGHAVKLMRQEIPVDRQWEGIDVVLECSGKFTSLERAEMHLKAGAGSVLLSTTGSPNIPLMIYGFNHEKLDPALRVISPGGCMTNCSVPVLDTLLPCGIESAQINILHSYTSRQALVDSAHNQYRRGRAAAESVIPVEIDLAHSLERLLPLEERVAALSVRVPVTNGAMADFTVQLQKPWNVTAINELFKEAAVGNYAGVMDYSEDPLVSADIRGNTHSCIIDSALTSVAGRQVKLIAWFDNEYGYTSRMIDWLHLLKKKLGNIPAYR